MGKHDDDWADLPIQKLEELYNSFDRDPPLLTRKTFQERIQTVPLRYDNVFRETLQEWADNNETLGQHADGLGADVITRLTGWLDNDDLTTFAWTHAADVLLYRGSSLMRERVKVHVANQLATAIHDAIQADDSWSVLAHSLGTSVLMDSLHALFTHEFPGLPGGFNPQNAQANLVMMVANVSRVLQTTPAAYDSTVKPGVPGAADRGCQLYLNAAHSLDPFLVPKPFDPERWPDQDPVPNALYKRIGLSHIHQANVHDLEHYLEHPALHIPLFRALTWDKSIPQDQEQEKLDSFLVFDNLSEAEWKAIKEDLDDAQVGAPASTWSVIEDVWDAYQAAQS
jgi:hypothetical protein